MTHPLSLKYFFLAFNQKSNQCGVTYNNSEFCFSNLIK